MLLENIDTYKNVGVINNFNEYENKNAPKKLYISGDEDLLRSGGKVSVIGTRKPTPEGIRRTKALVIELVKNNIIIVSGLAEGIDTVAHTTAIEAGGKTIAVLGTPLDKPYPKSNSNLLEIIKRDHLAVSQFPVGSIPHKKNFPIRNRTMALISDASIIIEAGENSGTRHQGWEALRLGRLLYLMESLTQNSNISWTKEMINYGAQILSRRNIRNALENLPRNIIGLGENVAF